MRDETNHNHWQDKYLTKHYCSVKPIAIDLDSKSDTTSYQTHFKINDICENGFKQQWRAEVGPEPDYRSRLR